jgi:dihydrofolate synthase / folylpolyglutamate synthase
VTVTLPGQAYRRLLEQLEATRARGVSLGLPRLQAALRALGSPEATVPAVHIAGTNGKGSTAAMTEAILRADGWRTGLHTSPHLSRFTERIRIEGQEVDGDWLAVLGERLFATGAPVTYFEAATALGFLAMAEARVQVAVLEVGLGGRLDATNLCRPVATAITSIAFDHQELLGDTLTAIAREKAGIAKPGVPLVLGQLPAEAEAEITRVAAAVGAPLSRAPDLSTGGQPAGPPRLLGAHQRRNAAVAAELARTAARALGRPLGEEVIAAGLAGVRWPGRLELVAGDVLLDAAHNREGVEALVAALPPRRPRTLVMSIVRGKSAAEMIALLAPHFDRLVFTRSANSRSTPPAELAALVPAAAAIVTVQEDARQALAEARRAGGLCVVAGSLFLVGEIRAHLLDEPVDPLVTSDPL